MRTSAHFLVLALAIQLASVAPTVAKFRRRLASQDECSSTCMESCGRGEHFKYGNYCGLENRGCEGAAPCDGIDSCCMHWNSCLQRNSTIPEAKCNVNYYSCLKKQMMDSKKEDAVIGFSLTCTAEKVIQRLMGDYHRHMAQGGEVGASSTRLGGGGKPDPAAAQPASTKAASGKASSSDKGEPQRRPLGPEERAKLMATLRERRAQKAAATQAAAAAGKDGASPPGSAASSDTKPRRQQVDDATREKMKMYARWKREQMMKQAHEDP